MRQALPALVAAVLLTSDAAGAGQTPPAPRPSAPWPALTVPPPDIERTDPALARLRALLLDAIRERSLDAVKALMAPTVRDQDTDTPVDDVLASFGPLTAGAPPGDEWTALEQALRMGGVRRGSTYVLPYIERSAARWKDRDERLFVAGRDVAIRANADPAASVVARVSHALVQEVPTVSIRAGEPGAACPDWTPVFDAERMLAWVCTTDVRPVSGLYYTFTRTAAGWKLTRIHSILD